MKLCGEAVLLLNAAIDTGLLACSARLCGEQLRWRRLILAGMLGGIYAVAAVLPGLGFLRHGLVKASMAAAICLISFGASARYFRLTAVFFAMGCLFAGLVTAFITSAATRSAAFGRCASIQRRQMTSPSCGIWVKSTA